MAEEEAAGAGSPGSNNWFGHTVFESALIIVGIILGFIVNEWREDIERQERADAALDRIIQELELNRSAVALVLPYHQQVASDLKALLPDPPKKPFIETLLQDVATGGIGDLELLDTAWQTAIGRDALAPIDFTTVQEIADVYDLAEEGAAFTQVKIIEFFADTAMFAPDTGGDQLRRTSFAYDIIVLQERYLLERYDALLADLIPDYEPPEDGD